MARHIGTFAAKGSDDTGTVPMGRPKGRRNKSTALAREAIASFVDGNSGRIQAWLDEIYDREGPKAAFNCFSDMLEYHVPKLARTEVTGADEGPVEIVISWAKDE
jgi:hypothetical protein